MKKILSTLMIILVLATLSGCNKRIKIVTEDKNAQTQQDKSKESDSKSDSSTAGKVGVINGVDVDQMLKDAFPNDSKYAYKANVTKDFVTKAENIKKTLSDKYKDSDSKGKNFEKKGKQAQLNYNFSPKDYKANLNEYDLSLKFDDDLTYSLITVHNELKFTASEQNAKVDDTTKAILKNFSNTINFEEVDKRVTQAISIAKDKKYESIDDIKVDDSNVLSFSSFLSDRTNTIEVTIRLEHKEYTK